MKPDSEAWRKQRNALLAGWVGDEAAVRWFLDFCHVCEIFDDLVDGDKPVGPDAVSSLIFDVLVEMPLNPFFDTFKSSLCPLIVSGVNAWLDANTMERRGTKDDLIKAFVLRDWYMEILSTVIYLTRGRDAMRALSMEIRDFFQSESFRSYSSTKKAAP